MSLLVHARSSPLGHCINFEESLNLAESLWKSEWWGFTLLLSESFRKLWLFPGEGVPSVFSL